jgi:hypothetical protein
MVGYSSYADRVMDQVVSYRHVTAEARVRSPASPCAISDRQSGTGECLSPSILFFSSQHNSLMFITNLVFYKQHILSQQL